MFNDELIGIIATSALELGLDIGSLDASLHLGFQGTVASLWQQAGRAGRRGGSSLAIWVPHDSPLDQYFLRTPHKLVRAALEGAFVNADNSKLLLQHLPAAAHEKALDPDAEEPRFGPSLRNAISVLESAAVLRAAALGGGVVGYVYCDRHTCPAMRVSLRAVDENKFTIMLAGTQVILEEMEEARAHYQIYEGAVYLRQGRTYIVSRYDSETKLAQVCQPSCLPGRFGIRIPFVLQVRRQEVTYFTTVIDFTEIRPMGAVRTFETAKGVFASHGRVQVPSFTAVSKSASLTDDGTRNEQWFWHSASNSVCGRRAMELLASAHA
jgi:ATP-dependent helicase YprA (DUF1998 family)